MLVLVAHALLLGLLASSTVGPWRRASAPAQRLTLVRLEAMQPPPAAQPGRQAPRAAPPPPEPRAQRTARGQPPRASGAPIRPAFAAPVRTEGTEPAASAPGVELAAQPAAAAPTLTGASMPGRSASAPTAPLRLELPTARRGDPAPSPAQQAVERQAGGQPRLNAEARMARRLETTWTEENLGDGRIRLRRGDDCVILKETTASQLEPWNNRGPAPRGASPCP